MTRRRIQIDYAVETQGPLHIGAGHGRMGLNRMMLRDHRGVPFIPGSTIKGRTRYAATRLCHWLGFTASEDTVSDTQDAAIPGYSDTLYSDDPVGAISRENLRQINGPAGVPDLPARIFGHAWGRSLLRFSDLRLEGFESLELPTTVQDEQARARARYLQERAHGLREIRAGAARSRRLGTVSHGRLYHSELAPPGLMFNGRVDGWLECRECIDTPMEPLILWLAMLLMLEDGIGGNKSSGSGPLTGHPRGPLYGGEPSPLHMFVEGVETFPPSIEDIPSLLELMQETDSGETSL